MKRTGETNNLIDEIHEHCIDTVNRIIYLHDDFKDESSGVDYRVATKFIKNISMLEGDDEEITVHLHSCGGDVTCGLAIYDSIASAGSRVVIVCHGVCASIATIILQAADERVAMKNCVFIFHEGSAGMEGTYRQFQSFAEKYKKDNDLMINILTEKCMNGPFFKENGYSKSKVKSYIKRKFADKEEWYLTAEEALHYGFIDRIYGV